MSKVLYGPEHPINGDGQKNLVQTLLMVDMMAQSFGANNLNFDEKEIDHITPSSVINAINKGREEDETKH